MRAHGNGNKIVCTANLLATVRGEVPYDRIRGLDGGCIDAPTEEAIAAARRDASWVLGVYEPRAEVIGIDAIPDDSAAGRFRLTAKIK